VLWQIFRGHRSTWIPLLSPCRFVEFFTTVICHVFMYCLGSFLLQDLLLSLHVFAFKGQNVKFTVNMFVYLHSNSVLRWRAQLWLELFASTVGWFLSRITYMYLPSYIFLRRCRSFTLRKLYVCLETLLCFLQLSDGAYVSLAQCIGLFLLWSFWYHMIQM